MILANHIIKFLKELHLKNDWLEKLDILYFDRYSRKVNADLKYLIRCDHKYYGSVRFLGSQTACQDGIDESV